ncbi:MAG: A/G-specific adenine glycosylase [Gammaproteobacteria bacterium]|nr:A/G-specific adenine glycosylase [Gammaproteobacteria bacterium]
MKFDFAKALLKWFALHGRRDLPWQLERNAYRVWISEIMLQQTQVVTVIPYFQRFMASFPNVQALAGATEDAVLQHWSGLGYYARARNLHRAAKMICSEYGAELPRDIELLNALPGIGRSTAAAILAQAHGLKHSILDGNVKRVMARYHGVSGWPGQAKVQQQLWQHAESHTPDQQLADYTQAIMDLGATLCRRKRPDCDHCPVSQGCEALKTGQVDALPTPKAKKSLPVKSARMLILLDHDNQVLLEKRPPTGIWGGLWSLPEMALDGDVAAHCQQQWQLNIGGFEDHQSFRHSFSHYHLDITPCRVSLKNPHQSVMEAGHRVWYNTCQPEPGGLASPVKTILNKLNED